MSNDTENEEHEYPNIVERFSEVLKKLGIKKHEAMVDHCAKGDLEDLEDIEQKLYEMGLHPSLRNQVISFWAAEIKQPVPRKLQKRLDEERGTKIRGREGGEETTPPEKYSVDTETGAIKVASTADKTALTWDEAEKLSKDTKKAIEEKERKEAKAATTAGGELKEEEKYSVDTETGAIKVASTTDKTALTWDEAEKLSTKIKRDIEEKERKEAKAEARERAEAKAGEGDKEPPFIVDSEGGWQLNPKARITGMELLAYEAVRKSAEKGEPLDPFEVMKERARDVEMMRSVFGGGGEGGGLSELTDTLLKLKELTGADEDTKALLSGIYKRLKEGGEGKGGNEEIKALNERIDKLVDELQKKELEKRDEQIERITTQLSDLRGELARQSEKGKATDEYGIMSEGLRVVDRRLGAIESTIQGIFGKRPALLPAGQKREITEAISEEAKNEKAIDELAEKVFYK